MGYHNHVFLQIALLCQNIVGQLLPQRTLENKAQNEDGYLQEQVHCWIQ